MKFPHSQKTSGEKVIYAKCSLIKQLVFFLLLITKCLNRLHLRSHLSQPNGRWGGWAEFQKFICKPVVGKKENTFQVTDIMPLVGGVGGVVRLPAACNWWSRRGWEEETRHQADLTPNIKALGKEGGTIAGTLHTPSSKSWLGIRDQCSRAGNQEIPKSSESPL